MLAIAIGADHAGFTLKEALKFWLTERGHRVFDCGTYSPESVDYPDFAWPVGRAVTSGAVERGVLVCGTGIGMAIAANKIPGVRAVACHDTAMARISREHNDANVLALGARLLPRERAVEILETWLVAEFAGGRHLRRIEKVMALEHGHAASL